MSYQIYTLPLETKETAGIDLHACGARFWKPKEKLDIVEWAERYRFLAKGVSAKSKDGNTRYRASFAPHQAKPQQCMTDPRAQAVVLMMASQIGGKTEMINNALGYHMHWRPTNQIVMYPTIESSEKYSKKKFTPMVEATPVVQEILAPARSRNSANTILVKDFLGGSVFFVGANSPPALRQASGEVLVADEIDSYEASAGSEGDPLELLFKRGESYPGCVKILSSTPTIKRLSRIESWFFESDQEYWHVPCPKCSKWQVLHRKQVKWPKGKPEEAILECAICAAALTDEERLAMYFAGEWRATAPFLGVFGFHLGGLYCPWPAQKGFKNRLHQIAKESERAELGGPTKMRVLINTFDCETYDEESESIPGEALYNRREDYSAELLPEGVIILTAAVDIHPDRFEVVVEGWGLNDENWGLEHQVIIGSPSMAETWRQLDLALSRRFKHPAHGELAIKCAFIDSGHAAADVYKFTRPRERRFIFACKGSSGPGLDVAPRKLTRNNSMRAGVAIVGTDTAKDMLQSRFNILTPGPRFHHFPLSYSYDFFQQLQAERPVRRLERGKVVRHWEKMNKTDRNEALDLKVYNLAAYYFIGRKPEAELKKLAGRASLPSSKISVPNAEPKPTPTEPQRKFGGKGRPGFISGWRKF